VKLTFGVSNPKLKLHSAGANKSAWFFVRRWDGDYCPMIEGILAALVASTGKKIKSNVPSVAAEI
jgi:hypothetical protein